MKIIIGMSGGLVIIIYKDLKINGINFKQEKIWQNWPLFIVLKLDFNPVA